MLTDWLVIAVWLALLLVARGRRWDSCCAC
jgi:hypothetical protein